jgi:hypothetical protein
MEFGAWRWPTAGIELGEMPQRSVFQPQKTGNQCPLFEGHDCLTCWKTIGWGIFNELARSLQYSSRNEKEFGMHEDNALLTDMSLRAQLLKLALDWELKALGLDNLRYRTDRSLERENLREKALAYRSCIADLSTIMNLGADRKTKQNL